MELTKLHGIGEKFVKALEHLQIFSLEDFVLYYPYRYEFLSPSVILESHDKVQVINAVIETEPKVAYIRRNFNSLRFRVCIQNKLIGVTIFNRAFMKSNLSIGREITLVGKYDEKKNQFLANDIKLNAIKNPKITPIYHLTKGIKNANFEKWMADAFQYSISLEDKIPIAFQENYHFMSKLEAIKHLHFPKEIVDLKKAKLRLIYEELFEFMFKILYLKNQEVLTSGLKRTFDDQLVYDFIANLPFSLTKDQMAAVEDGLKDLKSEKRMNRLLLGDVGSGKTIVAMILMYANVLAGYQSVMMAPTEILATQHYFSFLKMFEGTSLHIELYVGSMKVREKKQVLERICTSQVDIVIGTHALLNESIQFGNLGLVVTDEQHRFGVNQRKMLQNKGYRSDVLYLSATPIPRTYALTIYGDMDTSMIATKPNGRKPIITKVKKENELKEVLQCVLEEIKKGHQIYVVAPIIEESENEDMKDVNLLKEKFLIAFQNKIQVQVLHGDRKSVV